MPCSIMTLRSFDFNCDRIALYKDPVELVVGALSPVAY